jgi:hypothetical protein
MQDWKKNTPYFVHKQQNLQRERTIPVRNNTDKKESQISVGKLYSNYL